MYIVHRFIWVCHLWPSFAHQLCRSGTGDITQPCTASRRGAAGQNTKCQQDKYAKCQLDKYKMPATESLIDSARPLHTSFQRHHTGRGEILEITERIIFKRCGSGSRWNSRNPLTTEIWKSDDMPTIVADAILSTNFLTGKTLTSVSV